LQDDQIHYWYYYDKKRSENIYEPSFENAPKNIDGLKPKFIDIWHADENISLSTIKSAAREFAKKFLNINDCQVLISNVPNYEESVKAFEENKKLLGDVKQLKIEFSKELIDELSILWQKSKNEVLLKLQKTIK
jgi:hypothetical protein